MWAGHGASIQRRRAWPPRRCTFVWGKDDTDGGAVAGSGKIDSYKTVPGVVPGMVARPVTPVPRC